MRQILTAAILGGLALAGLVACASTGRSRTESTITGLTQLRNDADAGKKAIKATLDAMNALESGSGDLQPRYERFQNEFNTLQACADTAAANGDAMREKGTEYFKSWEEQIGMMKDPEVKESSKERRADLNELYSELTESMAACRKQYDKFVSHLGDIKQALDLDLSPNGVSSLDGPMGSARSTAGKVDTALDDVLKKLEALAVEMKSVQQPNK